jgi:solute:Na+ symporter, SSS family
VEQSGLILTVVITYLMLMCALGIFLRRRVNSFSDFLVAGRNTGLLVVTGSFIGSHFGGGMTVGGAEYGVIKGFSGVWYGFAAGFSYLLFLTIARKVYTLKLITLPDVLERSYHTKRIRAVFALLAFAGVLGIIGGQILAGGAIFEVFGVSKTTGGIVTFLIIVLYCSFSGLYGVMITDVIQVIIGGLGVVIGSIVALSKIGGFAALSSLPPSKLSLFPEDISTLWWIIIPTTLMGLMSQPSFQRVASAKNEKVAFRAPLLGGILVMILAVFPVLAGMCAQVLWPDIEPAKAIPQLLIEVFPPVIGAIFIAAILAAVMSTADSTLIAGTAFIMRDLYQQILRPKATDKHLLRLSMLVTFLIGLLSLAVTYLVPVIIDLFLLSYAIMVCGGLIPVVGGLLWPRATEKGAWASFITGLVFVILAITKVINVPYFYIVGLIPALIAFVLVSLVTKPVEAAKN